MTYDPNCPVCGGTGYTDYYSIEQSVAEPCCDCENAPSPVNVGAFWEDQDFDGWLDNVRIVRAKYYGRPLDPNLVTAIVMHCGASGSPHIARYFKNPDRLVSAHGVVTAAGTTVQCVPYTHRAWHAGSYNSSSLGIEHQGPPDMCGGSGVMICGSVRLVKSYMKVYPNIKTLYSHRYLAPARRSDPGPNFPWYRYEGLGLEIRA